MGLVRDHDDVSPLGQRGEPVPAFLGHELLDGGEHDSTGRPVEQLSELCASLGLSRVLPKQLVTAGEDAEELPVEVDSVGQRDDGRVLELGAPDQLAGEEGHGEALAGALRMPDDATAAVAAGQGRLQRRLDGPPCGVELVVARDLLRDVGAVVLEHDERAEEVEEPALLEHASGQHLQPGHEGRGQLLPLDGPPRQEPLLRSRQRPEPRFGTVRHDAELVVAHELRDAVLALVRLDLVVRGPDRGVLVGRILQFDVRQRDPVHEDQDVGPARLPRSPDAELVDDEPVVRLRIVEVDQADRLGGDPVRAGPGLDRGSVDEHAVEAAVVPDKRRRVMCDHLPEGLVQDLSVQSRVQGLQRAAEPAREDDVAVVVSLTGEGTRSDLRSSEDLVAERVEPFEERFLDGALSDSGSDGHDSRESEG